MLARIRAAAVCLAVLTLLTGVIYPVTVTLIARLAFPDQASGSLIRRGDRVVGSRLLGQVSDDPRYFWGRPSATGPMPGNAGASAGSNLSPTNPALADAVKARVAALRAADPEATGPVPADLVTASGSGLDPHISPRGAAFQVRRVARARGMSEDAVRALVERHTLGPTLGVLGESRVDVLALNLALDEVPR